jgi:murein DD-endopeptidase MepM/ murein hydrolase activator NlpD
MRRCAHPACPTRNFSPAAPRNARRSRLRERRTEAQGWRQAMVRPAPGRFSGRFGSQRIYRGQPGAYHGGLDMASPAGTPFVAPADGVVVLAAPAPFTLEGRLLMLDHGMGLGSAFCIAARIWCAKVTPWRKASRSAPWA